MKVELLVAGMFSDTAGRRTKFPRLTLLVLFGLLVGHSGFDLLPAQTKELFPLVSQIALMLICFLLGGRFTRAFIKQSGRLVMSVSIAKVIGSALFAALSPNA